MVIFFNLIGLAMLAVSCGIAFGVVHLLDVPAEGNLFMLISGPIALACDATYRWKSPTGHWLHPSGGGSFCFVPVWLFGALWLVLGIVRSITGRSDILEGVIIGLAVVGIIGVAVFRTVRSSSSPASAQTAPTSVHTARDWECSRCGHWNLAHTRFCKHCLLEN